MKRMEKTQGTLTCALRRDFVALGCRREQDANETNHCAGHVLLNVQLLRFSGNLAINPRN